MDSVIGEAIARFGVKHQKVKAVEELTELATELTRDINGKCDPDRIRDELADVIIMANQLRLIYGAEATDKRLAFKMSRLQKML